MPLQRLSTSTRLTSALFRRGITLPFGKKNQRKSQVALCADLTALTLGAWHFPPKKYWQDWQAKNAWCSPSVSQQLDAVCKCVGRPACSYIGCAWLYICNLLWLILTLPREEILLSTKVFTPMLAAAAVGTVEYRSILEHIRSANPVIEYTQGMRSEGKPKFGNVPFGVGTRKVI